MHRAALGGWAATRRSIPALPAAAIAPLAAALLLLGGTPAGGAGQEGLPSRGVVLDARSGTPVPDVIVERRPDGIRVLTGSEGEWRLPAGGGADGSLVFRHPAFAEVRVAAPLRAEGPLRTLLTPRPIPLDAVVVTAGRREQRLADTPVTTEVVTRETILRSGAADLSRILVEQTGIQVQGGHPTGAGIMLQGMDGRRVLVLVDGQPYIGRLSGDLDLSRIPTSIVERIEVVKGPQSTLYGSEAMGGVVNVVTRQAAGDRWEVSGSVTGGSDGRLDGNLEGAVPLGSTTLLLGGGHRSIDLVPGLASTRGAGVERRDGLARLTWAPRSDLRLRFSGMLTDERQRWRSGVLHQFADNLQWSARVDAAWARGSHSLTPTVVASGFDHLSRRGTSGTPPPASSGREQLQRLLRAETLYSWAPDGGRLALDAGVELRRESLEGGDIRGGTRDIDVVESHLQGTLDLGAATLVPGVRLSLGEWGTNPSPRLAALVRPIPELAVRLSVARGFRAPDAKELALEFLNVGDTYAYGVRGNPDLRPEHSLNLGVGVEWAGQRLYARAQLFHNRFEDFIETRAAGDSASVVLYTYDNLARGNTRGVELEGGLTRGGFRLDLGYAFLSTRDDGSGSPLLGRPRHSARTTLSHVHPSGIRTSLSGTVTGATPVRRTEEGGLEEREGFPRLDLRVSAPVPGGAELSLGVDNLADRRPEGWPGYAGRLFHVGLRYTVSGGRP